MVFNLEALNAEEGDCLLVQYGTKQKPSFVLIDGGPSRVYERSLQPRLAALRKTLHLESQQSLPLRLVILTHMDADHIIGILKLMRELEQEKNDKQPQYVSVRTLWGNFFDDLLGTHELKAVTESLQAQPTSSPEVQGFVASTEQGRQLRDVTNKLGIKLNVPFERFVMRPEGQAPVEELGSGLKLTLLGPTAQELKNLQDRWDKDLKQAKQKAGSGKVAAIAPDSSVFNLSSIAVLLELEGKSMLLTGDAHGNEVLAGLEAAGRMPANGGPFSVNLLKLPHHGSCRNVTPEFLKRVVAEHYVISANGTDGNPDLETLDMLVEARGNARYTLHCTFPEAAYKDVVPDTNDEKKRRQVLEKIHGWFDRRRGKQPTVEFRSRDQLGVTVKLGSD